MRRLLSFLVDTDTSGSISRWNGRAWRFRPYGFQIRGQTTAPRRQMVLSDMLLQDGGVT